MTIRTPSLGDSTYVVTHGSSALLVDPQRDIDRFLGPVAEAGLTLTHVLETHVHNDYVSGGLGAARQTAADLVLPAGAGVTFPHAPAFHREPLEWADGASIVPIHTPGHTPEHVSYLIMDGEEQVAVFTGGSLLVGSAGRTDLLGMELAEQLAVLQHGSLQRLAELPDTVGVYPTHGAGSFCSTGPAREATSTVASEKASNPALAIGNSDDFVAQQLPLLQPYPAYYAHMAPINRAGPEPIDGVGVDELSPEAVASQPPEVAVVDGRAGEKFASAHIPDAIGVELGTSFAPWVGWLVAFGSPVVLVLDREQDAQLAAVELARIGYDDIVGVMYGMEEWMADGRPKKSFEVLSESEALAQIKAGVLLVDVRAPLEWQAAHFDESVHGYVPDLADGLPAEIKAAGEVIVACSAGPRATIGAGLLERHGVAPKVVLGGGVPGMLTLTHH